MGQYQLGEKGNPDLSHDCIAAGSEKSLELQVLLEPLEKERHLPTIFVHVSYSFSCQMEIVGEKDMVFFCIQVLATYPAKRNRALAGFRAGEENGLVTRKFFLSWCVHSHAKSI